MLCIINELYFPLDHQLSHKNIAVVHIKWSAYVLKQFFCCFALQVQKKSWETWPQCHVCAQLVHLLYADASSDDLQCWVLCSYCRWVGNWVFHLLSAIHRDCLFRLLPATHCPNSLAMVFLSRVWWRMKGNWIMDWNVQAAWATYVGIDGMIDRCV